ncbi:AraC family transcriptional regulator [Stakelama tenebrarum]|uniref:Helix-turn-helix transcriptional regulator n=1 Tax=Stakelama tenebrarum TaxID=2711215 RepID=A0A6G6Y180_9SPHN|nr:helix-turn-helix transcriptional regulator [Sphingosinithalassobacter tenebrarum]QIG78567.1 helix-turn-helix transcriptional regulator [Sphingosinithalassobacter tenebrarum]
MPLLTELSLGDDWIDPDDVPRSVITYGFVSRDFVGIELEPHRHAKSQIMLVQRGALSCEVEGGLWVVPPRSAVWIPGGTLHSIRMTGALEGYNAFIAPDMDARLPAACCAVAVTPLLRELLLRTANLPLFYEEGGANSRLMAVLLDELAVAKVEDLHLPMPTDPRLRKIIDLMMASPADRGTLDAWADKAGLSARTLGRLISRETGMSFGRWRQQLGVILAVKWLAGGASIQQVAADLGYESVPSFVTMFRKVLGTSPGRYMAERHSGRP